MGLCRRGFGLLRCGILALLSLAERKYSFSLVRSGVSSTVFLHILSLVSIGLSIVAFTFDCLIVLTLGVGVSLTTLGVGVSICTLGGLAMGSKVTHHAVVVGMIGCPCIVGVGILFNNSSIFWRASISTMPFVFCCFFKACVRSFKASQLSLLVSR
mgnify:CR=1 FL=1